MSELASASKLVSVTDFAAMVCADGHVDPTGKGTCNVEVTVRGDMVPESVRKERHVKKINSLVERCGKKLGRPKVTIRAMCARGDVPGAVKPGDEWVINLEVARKYQLQIRGRGPIRDK